MEGKLTKIMFALSNPKRIEIYKLCLKQKLNITQISEAIKQSYKSTLNNLRILEEIGMIERTKQLTKDENAQESSIKSIPNPFNVGSVYDKVFKEILKEQSE